MKSLMIAMLAAALPALAQGPQPAAPTPPPCKSAAVCPVHVKVTPGTRPACPMHKALKAPMVQTQAQKAYERGYQQGYEAGFEMAIKLMKQHHPQMAPGPKAPCPGAAPTCPGSKPGMKPGCPMPPKPGCQGKPGPKPPCAAPKPGCGCCGPVVKPMCPQPSKKPGCCGKPAPAPKPHGPIFRSCTKAFVNGVEVDPATAQKMLDEMMSKAWAAHGVPVPPAPKPACGAPACDKPEAAKPACDKPAVPAPPCCKVPPFKSQVRVFVNGKEVEPTIRVIGPKPAPEPSPAPAPEPQPAPAPAPAPQA